MKFFLKSSLLLVLTSLVLSSCTASAPQEKAIKYPRKPADNPERKSGLPMLFYEAAEKDADPNKVIVIPPDEKKKANSQ